ncbi:uncharacterized protein LOC135577020 [Columba livia]|uniref:uncharacterized protein LOC135577020 n=1 Tax=Columba livia TaxID=8932 RepID=UPI0031BAC796
MSGFYLLSVCLPCARLRESAFRELRMTPGQEKARAAGPGGRCVTAPGAAAWWPQPGTAAGERRAVPVPGDEGALPLRAGSCRSERGGGGRTNRRETKKPRLSRGSPAAKRTEEAAASPRPRAQGRETCRTELLRALSVHNEFMGDPSGSRWPAVARQQQKRIEGTGRWRMPKPPGSAMGAALRKARGAGPCFLFPLLKRSCRVSVRCGEVLQDAALRNRLLWGCSCGQLLVSVVPALRRGVEPAPYVARRVCDLAGSPGCCTELVGSGSRGGGGPRRARAASDGGGRARCPGAASGGAEVTCGGNEREPLGAGAAVGRAFPGRGSVRQSVAHGCSATAEAD